MKDLSDLTKEVSNVDDLSIIELYFERDEQAIRETDQKYGKLCYKIAYNILESREDSEECVNDTYLGVWQAIPPTRPKSLMAFVCAITRNLSLKRLEAETAQKRSHSAVVSLSELEDILPDERIKDSLGDEELGRLISRFLRRQKADARNVFIRKYYFFDSINEISARYGFSESRVKNMLYHTRNRLRDFLIKEGVEI